MQDPIYTIFNNLPRLGPGDDYSTRKAFYALNTIPNDAHVLDIGCGTGQQTLELARKGNFHILALDNYEPYLRELQEKAKKEGLERKISVIQGDMRNLPFSEAEFDLIWSEGSIYIMGMEKGLREWKKFLRTDGYLVITEVCWIKNDPPIEVKKFWETEYPGMRSIKKNIEIIDDAALDLKQYFLLPDSAWWDNFYAPLQERIKILRVEYKQNEEMNEALDIVQMEINIFKKYSKYYGYVFFIMKKPA